LALELRRYRQLRARRTGGIARQYGRKRRGTVARQPRCPDERRSETAKEGAMSLRLVQFLAVVLTALSLVPAGAHLFELPNKIGLAQEAYFTVQGIYRGWALFGIALFGALAANGILAIMTRHQRAPFWLALGAFLLMAATLAVFFTWTFPANQATANWTEAPANWQELRHTWEYAHAVNAGLTFLALCAVTLGCLLTHDRAGRLARS
jgi:hypothetical protein